MGIYVYAITKTEHATGLWDILNTYGVSDEKQRVGVLEYLYKPNIFADPKARRWEQAQEGKVNRRWANKFMPSIVRFDDQYYYWFSLGAYWLDCNPLPATKVTVKVGEHVYSVATNGLRFFEPDVRSMWSQMFHVEQSEQAV